MEAFRRRLGRFGYLLPSFFASGVFTDSNNWAAARPFFCSLLLPGSGQILNGQMPLGIAAIAGTALFLAWGWYHLFSPFFFLAAGLFGALLVGVHMHAYHHGVRRSGGMAPPLTRLGVLFILISVIYIQMMGFSSLAGGGRTAVDLYAGFYQPLFQPGDRMIVTMHPTMEDLAKGDIVMVTSQFMERVIALPGERLEIKKQVVLVDGMPAIEKGFEPISAGNGSLRFFPEPAEVARLRAVPAELFQLVPAGHVGYLRDGKPGTVAIDRIHGRVDGIAWPDERRLRLPRKD